MVALSDIPLNSLTWSVGTVACLVLSYRSFASYRRSANELSKYIAWFGLIMGIAQGLFAIPPLFTLDLGTLRIVYILVELFVYISAVAQAAILWCLMLRSRLSIYFVIIPIAVLGTLAWLYSIPYASVHLDKRFINYHDPLFSTLVVGVMLIGLFVPVGIYFLRSVAGQVLLKAKLNSLALGVLYVGIGISTGGLELLTGEVLTRGSAIADTVLFAGLVVAFLWPRRPLPESRQTTTNLSL
ncbi:MAG TPA: hypothetical protein VFC50_02540 [Candidatus Dormibacteraeota bacterium]|nr:hypothetical protein [Candidatus Dormibacteraeota bacterium]